MHKKIAVISFQNADNYGAVLQHFALLEAIECLGHKAVSIDMECKPLEAGYRPVLFPGKKCITVKQRFRFVIKNMINFRIMMQHFRAFRSFRKKWFHTTGRLHRDQLCALDSEYDVFICGSDQVWNEQIISREFIGVFTLAFVTKAKKASYGASIGNALIMDEELYKNIGQMDYITVREGSIAKQLEEKLHQCIHTVCDPVFLWDKNTWDLFIGKTRYKRRAKHVLFLYFNDCPQACEIARYIKKRKGYSIVSPCTRNKFSMFDGIYSYGSDPFEFAAEIRNADFVVATSFHATVFSIIYEKHFISVPSGRYDTRLHDVLERLGLAERLVLDLTDYKARAGELEYMDYSSVREKLNHWRKESMDELKVICEL